VKSGDLHLNFLVRPLFKIRTRWMMLSSHARGEGRDQGERAGDTLIMCAYSGGIPAVRWFYTLGIRAEKSRMTWPKWSCERLISVVCRRRRPALLVTPHGTLEDHSGFSETTDRIRSLSHLRDDFVCWNFLYPKFALNLIATLPMQACGNQECRT
jgi:hypothetical protein